MPNQAWSDKRERQYEHIKDGLKEHGEVGGFGQQADSVVIKNLKQVAYSTSASTFKLSGTNGRSCAKGIGQCANNRSFQVCFMIQGPGGTGHGR